VAIGDPEPFAVTQRFQIVNVAHLCNGCGNCATFCPTAGAPYREKPRLYLERPAFEAALQDALLVARSVEGLGLVARLGGELHELWQTEKELRYRSAHLEATLDPALGSLYDARPGQRARLGATLSLTTAVRLAAVLQGLLHSLGHLWP
jgi:putative selenate reductase